MHRLLVEERRWISEPRFLHALSYCMLLPGPEAQQLATYIGWKLHGVRGGLVAGLLFVLPGFLAIMALSIPMCSGNSTPRGRRLPRPQGGGHRPRARGAGAHRKRALTSRGALWLAAFAFVAIAVLACPSRSSYWARASRVTCARAGAWARLPLRARRPTDVAGRRHHRRRPAHAGTAVSGPQRQAVSPVAALVVRARIACAWLSAREHVHAARGVLQQDGGGHVRRCVLRAHLCGSTGGRTIRLDHARTDAGRPGAGRNHTRAIDPRGAIRRIPGGVPDFGRDIPCSPARSAP